MVAWRGVHCTSVTVVSANLTSSVTRPRDGFHTNLRGAWWGSISGLVTGELAQPLARLGRRRGRRSAGSMDSVRICMRARGQEGKARHPVHARSYAVPA
eukprot:scaffold1168_cov123-Isochrysis_galbana.AAC.5